MAIVDVDAHHGNGVADCVQEEGRVRYCSIHENRTTEDVIELFCEWWWGREFF